MFVLYFGLVIVAFVIVLYAGLKLSENIYHPTLMAFFWILYLSSVLTISNVIATSFFYNVLRYKKGIPGDPGRIGEKGDLGEGGVCDMACDGKICTVNVLRDLNSYYKDLIISAVGKNAILNEEPVIKNGDIVENIKKICMSQAYKEISKVKTSKTVNDYIFTVYKNWIQLLVDSDKRSDKQVIRDYLETDGLEEKPVLPNNPFKEIEKYDVYYWGSDRIFHPRVIEYCAESSQYPQLTEKDPPALKGLKTNIYNYIIGSINVGQNGLSVYRAGPYNHQGLTYHSIGDVFVNSVGVNGVGKFIEKYAVPNKERTTLPNSVSSDGPVSPTIVLTGPDIYLRAPEDWELLWKSVKGPNFTIWKPKDYYDVKLKKWFRACGCLVMNNWNNSNPRQQFGFNNPEAQPIRLVAEELLTNVSSKGVNSIWNSWRSGSNISISIWNSRDLDYLNNLNVSIIAKGFGKPTFNIYNLKDSAFSSIDMKPIDFIDPLVDEDKLGVGFHGSPHRSKKYSIFEWLDMPIEVQVSNLANSIKIYVKHSGLNIVNSYMLRRQTPRNEELKGAFGIKPNDRAVSDDNVYNSNNKNLLWQIICIDEKGNVNNDCKNQYYLIKNIQNNKYFKVEVDTSTLGPVMYLCDNLPNKSNPNYTTIIQEFIWYNPKSATGNKLEMVKAKQ